MPKWLLPTLSEILALNDPTWSAEYASEASNGVEGNGSRRFVTNRLALQRVRAEREWTGAIAALNVMLQHAIAHHLLEVPYSTCGLILSGPLPVISHPDLVTKISTWSLTTHSLHTASWIPFKLLPSVNHSSQKLKKPTTSALPLLPDDPLASEQFCLVLTPWFSLVMVLGETLMGNPTFMFSFMPNVVQQAWEAIRPRILLMNAHQVEQLDDLIQKFPPVAPNYQTVMQFSRLMMEHLPEPLEEMRNDALPEIHQEGNKEVVSSAPNPAVPLACPLPDSNSPDVELLKALAHEIRTPLATIRTLTRSLLKRPDLSPDVLKRLHSIDRECSEQIDRFGLIFRAAELETSSAHHAAMALTRTSLAQMFQESIPRWQKQANQRQLTLDVVLPQRVPMVVSDPTMLDQALTSLIERFTRNLPAGSHIKVQVTPAGSQLKLQLESNPNESEVKDANFAAQVHQPFLKAIGQLLMFQPETGSLSLNLAVTKNLFQALGGKLIVKQRPQQGEVMTVFLPLEMNSSNEVDG
ncbi:sensor histidine kinase [Leptothermofonsia sp. ETS-13]|uniref:sensor histidine kinase n=1 Tax=Leptothermofonsia sp. ETS-13 TaxID=3035696 RepID=UPI003B9E92FE